MDLMDEAFLFSSTVMGRSNVAPSQQYHLLQVNSTLNQKMSVINLRVFLYVTIAVILLVISYPSTTQANDSAQNRLKEVLDRISKSQSSANLKDKDKDCTRNYNVDYIKLMMSWGPGLCSSGKLNCRSTVKPEFTVHGLWPQQKNKESPVNCCTNQAFNMKSLRPIKDELKRYWPSLNGLDEGGFWPYQWDKHGSCATKITGLDKVYDYFNFAINSMKESDFTNIITKQFKPSNNRLYYGDAIIMALTQVYGAKLSIECAKLKNKPQIYAVTEISACFDTKLKLIDCPYTKRRCLGQVLLPLSVM